MSDVKITVEGLDKIMAGLNKFPRQIGIYIGKAGGEAANRVVLPTQGLQKYPPATAANFPPYPFYERGKGVQTSQWHNTGSSEKFGTQWYTKRELSEFTTEIGNRASYGIYVSGDRQPAHMAAKGWRKLPEVVNEKMRNIVKVYKAWIDKCIHDLGL